MKKYILIIIISILTLTTNVRAEEIKPSFDCAKAKSEVEKLICSDNKLAKLDVQMNESYNKFKVTLDTEWQKKLKQKQNKWLKNRSEIYCMKDVKYDYILPKEEPHITKNTCLKRAYEHRIKKLDDWTNKTSFDFFIDETLFAEEFSNRKIVKIIDKYGEESYFCHNGNFAGAVFINGLEEEIKYYVRGNIYYDVAEPEIFYQNDKEVRIFYSEMSFLTDDMEKDEKSGKYILDSMEFYRINEMDIYPKKFPSKEEYEKNANDILNSKLSRKRLFNEPEPEFCKGIFEKVEGQSLRKWINEKFKTDDIEILYPNYFAYYEQDLKEKTKGQFKCSFNDIKKQDEYFTPSAPYLLFDNGDNWIFGVMQDATGFSFNFVDKNSCEPKSFGYLDFDSSIVKINDKLFLINNKQLISIMQVTNHDNKCSFD